MPASDRVALAVMVVGMGSAASHIGLLAWYPDATKAGAFWPWYAGSLVVLLGLVWWYDRVFQRELRG